MSHCGGGFARGGVAGHFEQVSGRRYGTELVLWRERSLEDRALELERSKGLF